MSVNEPRCSCGNIGGRRPDGGCACMCHPINQQAENQRISDMLTANPLDPDKE